MDGPADASADRLPAVSPLARAAQDYIEQENRRLESEHQFWAKEIIVKINYKFSPNLTIIDTPGAHGSPSCAPVRACVAALTQAQGGWNRRR